MRRSSDQVRAALLEAAIDEFSTHGLAGARIDRIAKASNTSKERLYAHFRDKRALFEAVVGDRMESLLRNLTERAERAEDIAGVLHDLTASDPRLIRMLTWAHLEGGGNGNPLPDRFAELNSPLVELIEHDRNPSGPLRDVPASDLLAAIFALNAAWVILPIPPDPEQSPPENHLTLLNHCAANLLGHCTDLG